MRQVLHATGEYDEAAYAKFVANYTRQLQTSWRLINGEELSDAEAQKKAELDCDMYRHQFRLFA